MQQIFYRDNHINLNEPFGEEREGQGNREGENPNEGENIPREQRNVAAETREPAVTVE